MPAATALDRASALIRSGVRELPGKSNRSPLIDQINQFVRQPLGSPYCAAGESFCFDWAERMVGQQGVQALLGHGFKIAPKTGSSLATRQWYARNGLLFTDPQHLLECKGAVFGWTGPDGIHGHTGLIRGRLTTAGIVVAIQTAEFNTSPQTQDRDGEGAFFLERAIESLQLRDYWFGDTSRVVGGAWWA